MSDPMAPAAVLRSFDGFVRVAQVEAPGMIALRARIGTEGLEAAVESAIGLGLPEVRGLCREGARACAWMSPDEWLLIMPRGAVGPALAALAAGLEGRHHLAAEVSDARAMFRIEGPRADDVLAKLTPADPAALPAGEVRRSRLAQVAAAFWREQGGWSVVTFRSVADYAFGVLANAAEPGSELDRDPGRDPGLPRQDA